MRIVVIGAGKVGKKIAERLLAENHDITVVDNDPVRLNALIGTHDIMSVQGERCDIRRSDGGRCQQGRRDNCGNAG